MGAGFFFARPRRKAGIFMGDGNDGAVAQAQVAGEPQAQVDQTAQAAVTAGLGGDIPLLLGITVISAAIVFAGNFTANLLYGVVDPRIRSGRARA